MVLILVKIASTNKLAAILPKHTIVRQYGHNKNKFIFGNHYKIHIRI